MIFLVSQFSLAVLKEITVYSYKSWYIWNKWQDFRRKTRETRANKIISVFGDTLSCKFKIRCYCLFIKNYFYFCMFIKWVQDYLLTLEGVSVGAKCKILLLCKFKTIYENPPYILVPVQFPIKWAFAMTIPKSQGWFIW